MIKAPNDYKTDFESEFRRWRKETPPADLISATYREQQEALEELRSRGPFELIVNTGSTKKKDNSQAVNHAIKHREEG